LKFIFRFIHCERCLRFPGNTLRATGKEVADFLLGESMFTALIRAVSKELIKNKREDELKEGNG